jgi:uncharacterized protein (DUF427 family)
MRRPTPDPVASGQESVWDYPRPPRLEASDARVEVVFGGRTIVDTRRALRLLETSHPPSWYLPAGDCDPDAFRPSPQRSFCEFKGVAEYFDVVVGDRVAPAAAWCYPEADGAYAALAGHRCLYPRPMDVCRVDGVVVVPQEGPFYGGWITPEVVGPFKGPPGTSFW